MAILSEITKINSTTPITLAQSTVAVLAILNGAEQFVTLTRALGDADTEEYRCNKDLIDEIKEPS
jgi:hypothetical protein